MRTVQGRIQEIFLEPNGQTGVQIACPPAVIPTPGQYCLAWSPRDVEAPLPVTLFPTRGPRAGNGHTEPGFAAVAPVDLGGIPSAWQPGETLWLRGPMGMGFHLPAGARRVALAALGDSCACLLGLIPPALAQGAAITLYANGSLPPLPSDLEVSPLESLPEALAWADWLALDLLYSTLPTLRLALGLDPQLRTLPCPAEALVQLPMPCGGVAECGACAVPVRGGWKLACKEGPVFDLSEIDLGKV